MELNWTWMKWNKGSLLLKLMKIANLEKNQIEKDKR